MRTLAVSALPLALSALLMTSPLNATIIFPEGVNISGVLNNANTIAELSSTEAGQARVEALSGTYNFLEIPIPSTTFQKIVWNLDTVADSGTVVFTMDGAGYEGPDAEVLPYGFALGNGHNFFTIAATDHQSITVVSYQTTGVKILDTQQIRIGGMGTGGDAGTEVPEPTGYIAVALGLGCFAFLGHCREISR